MEDAIGYLDQVRAGARTLAETPDHVESGDLFFVSNGLHRACDDIAELLKEALKGGAS